EPQQVLFLCREGCEAVTLMMSAQQLLDLTLEFTPGVALPPHKFTGREVDNLTRQQATQSRDRFIAAQHHQDTDFGVLVVQVVPVPEVIVPPPFYFHVRLAALVKHPEVRAGGTERFKDRHG